MSGGGNRLYDIHKDRPKPVGGQVGEAHVVINDGDVDATVLTMAGAVAT